MEKNEKKKRSRLTSSDLIWSSNWLCIQPSVSLRIEAKKEKYYLACQIEDDVRATISHSVYDHKEPLLNTRHQEITKIPHEIRGEAIRSLKGRGFIRKVCKSILKPVDVDAQCCLLLSRYVHGQPLPVFAD